MVVRLPVILWLVGVMLASHSMPASAQTADTPPAGYVLCAAERAQCNFSGTATVVYGARSSWTVPRPYLSTVACNNTTFSADPVPGVPKSCYQRPAEADVPPAGFVRCTTEGSQCSFSGTAEVIFGGRASWTVPRPFSSAVLCRTSSFGADPLPGVVKSCYFRPAQADVPPAGFTRCASEGARCVLSATSEVVYGARTSWTRPRSFTGGTACSNAVFGDPLAGTVKACYAKLAAVTPTPLGLSLTLSGSGGVRFSDGSSCMGSCEKTFNRDSTVTLVATPSTGYAFAGWGGACSGVGSCTLSMNAAKIVSATFSTETPPPGVNPIVASQCLPGSGRDYQVGPNAGQLATLADVPWENLGAGDTVRIFHRATPYAGKFLISAVGSAAAPVRICGVKGPNGERPAITGVGAATRRALAGMMGSQGSVASQYNESRGVIFMSKKTADAWTSFPSHIQIDGLKIGGAQPAHQFTDSFGVTKSYMAFGACIWIDRGQNVTIADNEITDCSQGIYSRSTEDGDFAVTKNLRIAGNTFTNYGLAGDQSVHGAYTASDGVVFEFNRFGAMRPGANGNAIKDRSAGTVVRFNRIEDGARAVDLVEAEDFPNVAKALSSYRTTFVYGNQITKDGNKGSAIHYGGDHAGSEANYRKGVLYFFNNTVQLTGGGTARIFQPSTTEERIEAWNNVFYADASTTLGFRQGQDNAAGYEAGGIVNLGRNWVQGPWYDVSPYHTLPGQLNGTANLIVGSWATVPVEATTMAPKPGSAVVDVGTTPAGLSSAIAPHPVNWQLDSQYRPKPRSVNGALPDLGALEY